MPNGGPLHPERFSRTFSRQTARAESPPVRLYDLRHTWATLALQNGVHPKIVQERLGHANVSITFDVYSHVSEGLHSDAASRIASIIFGPVSSALANTGGGGDDSGLTWGSAVPERGVEPLCPFGQTGLSRPRIPFRHPGPSYDQHRYRPARARIILPQPSLPQSIR
jgi:Phage integrase family